MKTKISMLTKTLVVLVACISFFTSDVFPQLKVNNSVPYNSIDYLVKNILIGKGVQVLNVSYSSSPLQIGFFDGTNSNLNLDSGIIITTGSINNAPGPNTLADASTEIDAFPLFDTDLMKLSNADSTFDKAIIEFDFIANADSISFKYVFGSEEYMEYVSQGYNDAFGFFLSGPGINGTFSNKAINLALLPNSNTPVTIDNINADTNAVYYVDNSNMISSTIQYDGFTIVLNTKAKLQCGKTYHIKLAIADAGDPVIDSGIFLGAASFSSVSSVTASFDTDSFGLYNQTIKFEDKSKDAISWYWNFGDEKNSVLQNPIHSYEHAGTYTIMQIASNGCVFDTFTKVVFVKENLAFPNVFTPNGDGKNDEYYFPNSGIKEYSAKIYDRWGALVYEANASQHKWDGKDLSGRTMPAGTYFYVLQGIFPKTSGEEIPLSSSGYISLLSGN